MKQAWRKILFLGKLSRQICPYYYWSKCLDELLKISYTCIYIFLPKLIIDAMTQGKAWEAVFGKISIFIGAVILCKGIDVLSRAYRNARVNQSDVDAVKHYCVLYSEMDYEKFESAEVRDQLEVVMGKIRGNTSVDFWIMMISSAVQLFLYAAVLVTLSPVMLIVLFCTMLIKIYVNNKRNLIEDETISGFKRNSRRFQYIDNAMACFDFAKEIRTNQADGLFEDKYKENINERYALNTSYEKRLFGMDSLENIAKAAELLALYGYAGYRALQGEISLGSFSMYIAAVSSFVNAVSELVKQILDMKLTLKFVDKYTSLLDMMQNEKKKEFRQKAELPKPPYTFEFCDVSFSYPHTDKLVLKHISLSLAPGEKLSLVGENGAGKTTFIKLLCGIYVPTSGKILVNGVDIQSLKNKEYTNLISAVFQDYQLFSFNVAENVVLDAMEDQEKLHQVLQNVGLEEKIEQLPNNIHTAVDKQFEEDGVEFSGGEQQKLALARACYKASTLVILDEPTASMDPIAELRLYSKFNDIIGKRTAVFISHRLASAKFCDKVVVFANGEILEQGTHESLMQAKGKYYEMFHLQTELYAGDKTNNFKIQAGTL